RPSAVTAEQELGGAPLTPVPRASRGPSAGLVLACIAVAVVGAVLLAVASSPAPAPAPTSPPVALGSPTATPPNPAPPPTIRPSATPLDVTRTVTVLRGVADPAAALGGLTGCAHVRTTTGQLSATVQGGEVDATAAAAGRDAGWLFVPPGVQAATKVWLGDDVVGLALAAGEPVAAVGTDGSVWLGGPAGGTRWLPVATPAGRTAWVITADEIVGQGACEPWTVPDLVAGQRSLTCAGLGVPLCIGMVARLRSDTPDLLVEGADLVVVTPACAPGCSSDPTIAVSVPVGWAGDRADLRAATPIPSSGSFTRLPSGILPAAVLDVLGRPALPLPTGGERARRNDCSETLAGTLSGAPWDPRVAWVGAERVVWPSGTVVRFLPSAVLSVPGAAAELTAGGGDRVVLTGSLDTAAGQFDACSVQPLLAAAVGADGPDVRRVYWPLGGPWVGTFGG
ncbi:MAG TPA: hypothetical protein VMT69_04450, partial [Kineosporiaceae bacterium]|nr:hypothetical protein [Kineosporiaceae bacterium]